MPRLKPTSNRTPSAISPASSSTVWIPPASTEGWRVNGLVTAGNSVSRDVVAAAWPRTTNVSRERSWLSRIPAPSKPAASMAWTRETSSGTGAVPGTRRCTRTGSDSVIGGLTSVNYIEPGRREHDPWYCAVILPEHAEEVKPQRSDGVRPHGPELAPDSPKHDERRELLDARR